MRKLIISLGAALIHLAIKLLMATWKIEVVGEEFRRPVSMEGKPRIFAFFHGQMLPLLPAKPEGSVSVLVSRSRDGDLAAGVLGKFRFQPVRGSTHRDAAGGLKGLLRALGDGCPVAVTVDGSRGPRYEVKPGVAFLSARSGCEIIPVAAEARPAVVLRRSWDHFRIPLPFARIAVRFGEPERIPACRMKADFETAAERLKTRLLGMAANP